MRILLLTALFILSSCNTFPTEDSAPKDIGGPIFTTWSCSMTKYDFEKYFPLYLHHMDVFNGECLGGADKSSGLNLTESKTPNLFFAGERHHKVLEDCVARNNQNFGACIQNIHIEELPDYQPDRDGASNYCRGVFLNMADYRRRITKAVYRWQGLGKFAGDACDDGQLDTPDELNTKIYDFPACDLGCLGGSNHDCQYCKWDHEEKRAGHLDHNGAIACNTELTARKAVKEWCVFYGINEDCDIEKDISCEPYDKGLKEKLSQNSQYAGVKGNPTPTGSSSLTIKHAASFDFTATGKVKGKIPFGHAAGADISYKYASSADYSISIQSDNLASLFDEAGLGSKNSKFSCSLDATKIDARSLSGHLDLTLLGNGATFSSSAADQLVTNLSGRSNDISAAGQSIDQIKARCHNWGTAYMKAKIDGSFLVAAALNKGKYLTLRSRSIQKPDVSCLYNKSWNMSFDYEARSQHVTKLAAVKFTFSQSGVNMWVVPSKSVGTHNIEAWSPLLRKEFSYEELMPWLKKIYDNKIEPWEMASLLNHIWVPATNNTQYGVGSNGALHKCWEHEYYPYSNPLKD